jgi:hypothetical protein
MGEQSGEMGVDVRGTRFSAAFEAMKPAMLALPADEVRQVYIDIPSAVTTVLGALPAILATRPEFVKHLPTFPIELMDTLELRTLAMQYADTMKKMSTKQLEPVPQLVARGLAQGRILLGEIKYAHMRGLIDAAPVEELGANNSHHNIASNLFAYSYLLRSNWAAIQGKTALSLQELNEAEQTADYLLTALGARKQAAHAFDPTSDLRERAFTLFILAQEQLRAAIKYRFEGTADQIIPSVREVRGAGKKQLSEEEIIGELRATTGVHPVVKEEAQEAAEDRAQPIAVGMPGSSPYTT